MGPDGSHESHFCYIFHYQCHLCDTLFFVRDALTLSTHMHTCYEPCPSSPSSQSSVRHHIPPLRQPSSHDPPSLGRGDNLLSCGDIESNPGPKDRQSFLRRSAARPFRCPFPDCTWLGAATRTMLIRHLNSVHFSAGQIPHDCWLTSLELWHCKDCATVQAESTSCGTTHGNPIPTAPPSSPDLLTGPEPLTQGPLVRDILGIRAGTIRHIPAGARAACGRTLGILLRSLITSRTWDGLRCLVLFPKFVLRIPPRWGKRHRRTNTQSIIDCCTAMLERPIQDIWTPPPHLCLVNVPAENGGVWT